MKSIKFILTNLILILLIIIGCNKTSDNIVDSQENKNQGQISDQPLTPEFDFFMPDSIPDIINKKALEMALSQKCSNIRLLQLKDTKNPTFHIYFFEDDLKGIAAYTAELNVGQKEINKLSQVSLPYDAESLEKTLTDTKCWTLATFYTGAYQSGTSFTFSQQTTTHGWYHKIAMNLSYSLGCCGGNYSGSLDNVITSHYWEDDCCSPYGRIARPIAVHVYDEINLDNSGSNYQYSTYSGDHRYHVYYPPVYSNHDGDWDGEGVDDMVSSIDMFYRVFTPS